MNNKLHRENGPNQPFYLGLSRKNKDQDSRQGELNFTVLFYLVLNKIFSKTDDGYKVEIKHALEPNPMYTHVRSALTEWAKQAGQKNLFRNSIKTLVYC